MWSFRIFWLYECAFTAPQIRLQLHFFVYNGALKSPASDVWVKPWPLLPYPGSASPLLGLPPVADNASVFWRPRCLVTAALKPLMTCIYITHCRLHKRNDTISAPTLTVFRNSRNCLKTDLFSRSFPSCFRFLDLYTVYRFNSLGHSK